jgi:Putative porin
MINFACVKRFISYIPTLFFAWTFFFASLTQAQILDDSTQMKYNPTSVILQTGEDVYYNRQQFSHPSTSLTGLQSYQPLFQKGVYSQDLGNYLTPRGLIIPSTPNSIGARYGFHAFDDFSVVPDSVTYIDTRSPYTSLDYVQGSKGQQRMYVTHSRNVTARWNLTAMIRRMGARKLLGAVNTTDRQAGHWSFGLTSRYYSKSARYQLLAQVISMSHLHYDQGGILPSVSDSTTKDLYDYNLSTVNLKGVTTTDKRVTGRLYHQYGISTDSSLQVFNQLDILSRTNQFSDPNTRSNAAFYPAIYSDSNATSDKVTYLQSEVRWGVKGIKSFLFYALYYKARYYKYEILNSTALAKEGLNTIVGGELRGKLHKAWNASVSGEWSPASSEQVAEGSVLHKLLEVRYKHMQYTPTFQEQLYDGNHIRWDNSFDLIQLQQLTALLHLRYKSIRISPDTKWMRFKNYVYIDQFAHPAQFKNDLEVWSSTINLTLNKRLWILENTFQYNFSSDDNILRVPETVNQTRLLLQGYLFKKATFMQVGVDVFFRSAWVGNRYMPVTQQYYLGNAGSTFNRLDAYALCDVFLTMQVKTARFFVKMAYVNQGLGSNGYLVTPYYSGMTRTFEFGINWQFFD